MQSAFDTELKTALFKVFFYLLLVPKTSPTDATKSDDMEWDWLVLGIVIGAVAFAILCLILGIM